MKERTGCNTLLKRFIAVLLCLALPAAACGSAAEEEEPLTWSEPGLRYIAGMLAPQREIRNEEEARAYAEELCPMMGVGPLPEGSWEIRVDLHDGSWHCSIMDEESAELYGAHFLSNGVIQMLTYPDPDPRRFSEGVRREGPELDTAAWEQVKPGVIEWVEKIAPGILELTEPLDAYSAIDTGEKQYLFASALPLDPELDGCIHMIIVLYGDGHFEIMDYSCYGAG